MKVKTICQLLFLDIMHLEYFVSLCSPCSRYFKLTKKTSSCSVFFLKIQHHLVLYSAECKTRLQQTLNLSAAFLFAAQLYSIQKNSIPPHTHTCDSKNKSAFTSCLQTEWKQTEMYSHLRAASRLLLASNCYCSPAH